jgi:hypothetical protein
MKIFETGLLYFNEKYLKYLMGSMLSILEYFLNFIIPPEGRSLNGLRPHANHLNRSSDI